MFGDILVRVFEGTVRLAAAGGPGHVGSLREGAHSVAVCAAFARLSIDHPSLAATRVPLDPPAAYRVMRPAYLGAGLLDSYARDLPKEGL